MAQPYAPRRDQLLHQIQLMMPQAGEEVGYTSVVNEGAEDDPIPILERTIKQLVTEHERMEVDQCAEAAIIEQASVDLKHPSFADIKELVNELLHFNCITVVLQQRQRFDASECFYFELRLDSQTKTIAPISDYINIDGSQFANGVAMSTHNDRLECAIVPTSRRRVWALRNVCEAMSGAVGKSNPDIRSSVKKLRVPCNALSTTSVHNLRRSPIHHSNKTKTVNVASPPFYQKLDSTTFDVDLAKQFGITAYGNIYYMYCFLPNNRIENNAITQRCRRLRAEHGRMTIRYQDYRYRDEKPMFNFSVIGNGNQRADGARKRDNRMLKIKN
ncbi:hypothetical protein BJ742DRAFT_873209 [Cladochytrium replicatum]|nr:hypothetical protein BJ742DRAFT_873209 [Cladochytrium replicatum]